MYLTIAKPVSSFVMFTVWMLLLTDFRYDKKKISSIVISSEMLIIALNILLVALLSYEVYLRFYIIIIYVMVIPLMFVISKNRDYRDIFTIAISVFFSGCVSVSSMLVSALLGGSELADMITRVVIFVPLCVIMIKYVRPEFLAMREQMPKGWAVFSMLPICGIALSFVFINRNIAEGDNRYAISLALLCTVGAIMFVTALYIIYFYFVTRNRDRMLNDEHKRLENQQDKYWEQVIEKQDDRLAQASRYRHDMRHHCTVAAELIRDGRDGEAIKYLEELGAKVSANKPVLICENRAVNCVLDVYGEKARDAGIEITFDTQIPDALSLSGIELAGLFANSIENAIEGCGRLPENAEKYIHVTSFWRAGKLRMKVENPCAEVIFKGELPVSSKQSGGGIGTSSIAQTVKNHSGVVSFSSDNGIFTFAAVVPAELYEPDTENPAENKKVLR